MTGHGAPDNARAARYILKDYVTGRLLYCFPPDDEISREMIFNQLKKYKKINLNETNVCIGWDGEGTLNKGESTLNEISENEIKLLNENKLINENPEKENIHKLLN